MNTIESMMQNEARMNLEMEIADLKSKLSSNASPIGDYTINKCVECNLLGLPLPYDLEELHRKRQSVRDQINELQDQLNSMNIVE